MEFGSKNDPTLALLRNLDMLELSDDLKLDDPTPPYRQGAARSGDAGGPARTVADRARTSYSEQTLWMIAVRDQRDKTAFAQLFDFYAPRLKAMAVRTGMRSDEAEDIVQEVLLTAWRKAAQFDPERAQVSSWIYQIARNRQVDLVRKERRPVPEELKLPDADDEDANQVLGLEQETSQLKAALSTLSEDQRIVVEKAYLGELSHSEIRDVTGLPLGTIKSRIRLGLERLRHELKELR